MLLVANTFQTYSHSCQAPAATDAQELAGAVIFGTSGIALNLGQKAEAQDIKAIYVTQKAAP